MATQIKATISMRLQEGTSLTKLRMNAVNAFAIITEGLKTQSTRVRSSDNSTATETWWRCERVQLAKQPDPFLKYTLTERY